MEYGPPDAYRVPMQTSLRPRRKSTKLFFLNYIPGERRPRGMCYDQHGSHLSVLFRWNSMALVVVDVDGRRKDWDYLEEKSKHYTPIQGNHKTVRVKQESLPIRTNFLFEKTSAVPRRLRLQPVPNSRRDLRRPTTDGKHEQTPLTRDTHWIMDYWNQRTTHEPNSAASRHYRAALSIASATGALPPAELLALSMEFR